MVGSVESKHPCIGDVAGGMVLFFEGLEMDFDFRFGGDGKAVPKVLGTFGFEKALTRTSQRPVGVLHVRGHHPSKQKDSTKLRVLRKSNGDA